MVLFLFPILVSFLWSYRRRPAVVRFTFILVFSTFVSIYDHVSGVGSTAGLCLGWATEAFVATRLINVQMPFVS